MLYLLFRAVRLCQIRQDIRPQCLLLPQGIKAAVQIYFVDRCKNGAAQQQTLIVERSFRLGCLAAEHHRKTGLQFLAENIVGCPGGAVLPLHFEQSVDVFNREHGLGDGNVHQGCNLIPGVFFADGVIHHPFFDVVAYHRRGQFHPAEAAEVAVDELHRLVQIQPYRGEIVVPGQGKARSTCRNAEFGFSFHSILFRSCSCTFCKQERCFLCKGRAIAFRKSASACEIVYRILENWSTVCENFVKEFEKTVDRFLKNCYDGHGQRNDCGVRRLKMEKNMKSKIVVDSSANVYQLPDVDFACVPLKILTDEQEYVDTEEVDAPALAQMMRTYKGRTSTSCPNISDWLTAYEGADEVYVVTITGTLSGAYNAALLAGEEYEQNHEGARVFVLDSLSTGAESRLLVERLAALIKAGKPFDTVCEEIRAYHEHTHLLFALESLANLARNGRVKPAVAAVARMLGIRVIGQASDAGDLEVLCKTRGEHGALERIVLEMKAHGLTNGRVHIDHCCNAAAAERLKHMVHAVFPEAKVEVGTCGALCSYYAEYGGLMVGYEDNEAPTV